MVFQEKASVILETNSVFPGLPQVYMGLKFYVLFFLFICLQSIEFLHQLRQHIKKQRYDFANKGPSSQGYGFCSSHVWMWGLDYKESWAPKNWCFWTVVLEKTLETPLDCKEIQLVHPNGDQSLNIHWKGWCRSETPLLWPPDAKSRLTGKHPDAEKDWR